RHLHPHPAVSRVSGALFCHFFFLTDPATTRTYTLSLHDALPIYQVQKVRSLSRRTSSSSSPVRQAEAGATSKRAFSRALSGSASDRKSTRLNSSHVSISYAVFCLKKKRQ